MAIKKLTIVVAQKFNILRSICRKFGLSDHCLAAVPIILIAAASIFNVIFAGDVHRSLGFEIFDGGLGGPVDFGIEGQAGPEPVLSNNPTIDVFAPSALAVNDQDTVGFVLISSDSILNSGSPLSNILPTRDGLMIYKIQEGDTLSNIAANFGISLNTILWANKNLKSNLIKPGQEIVILPVSGALHEVQDGETIDSIVSFYAVDKEKILDANKNVLSHNNGNLAAGVSLVIPGAKPKSNASNLGTSLPNLSGYFVIPTTGWNWGRLHSVNAVDIANACGTPIYAAAEGLVVAEKSSGWNDGYGNYIDIEHPNGTTTRYSHTEKNVVSVGDYVLQGDLIAYIGNTGNTHGPTGCHLHFEVRGARNPFAK